MSHLTEITEVLPAPPSADLSGFALDTPKAGLARDTYAFDLRGWAIGARSPASAALLHQDGALIRRMPVDLGRPDVAAAHPQLTGAERSGFFGTFSALALDPRFALQLDLTLEDQTRLPLALLRGTRAPLVSPFSPRLQPLVLTTMGRTGSTAVVRMLAAHPEVVAYRPFEHEPRVATYWMDVFRALSDPAGYRRQLSPTGLLEGTWWLGHQTPLPRPLHDPALDPWLDATAIGELAAVAQERIERLYIEVAAAQGRPNASHFVEKYRPDSVPRLMLELYPGAREVMLVRDFRDMIASMFAYNEKRGRQGFSRDRATSDHDYVVNSLRPSVVAMADAWRSRSARAHLLRYEDLVQRPEETVQSLLGHLGLDAGPKTVAPMVASLTGRDSRSEAHRTISDPEDSIGRWRGDLSDEVAAACAEALGPSLETFGYEPA
jgi:hypothetical protein